MGKTLDRLVDLDVVVCVCLCGVCAVVSTLASGSRRCNETVERKCDNRQPATAR